MDARSGYMFENIIAKIFSEAGYAIQQDVQLEKRSGDIDIVAEKEGNSYCIEVKYSQLIEKAVERIYTIGQSCGMTPILVTAFQIDEKKRSHYQEEYPDLILIDIANLLFAVQYRTELRNELIAILPFTVVDIEPQKGFVQFDSFQHDDYTNSLIAEMQKASDALCGEYGLSVIENPQRGKSRQYGEWRAEQEGRPTWRGLIRAEIDEVIRQSMTERQFFDNLRKRGYEVKVGKDISVRPPGKERFVRLERNFGEDYSYDGIRKRILAQFSRERLLPEPERKVRRAKLRGDFKNTRKVTGFRALYFHYCYLLGIFSRSKPKSNKRLHFLLREDLAKLDAISEETKLLVRNHIDTAEQLFSFKEGLETKIESLTADRKTLYRKQRTVSVKSDDDALNRVKEQITAISRELSALRKEVRLCEDIAIRSGVIKEKIRAVREDEQSQGKENKRDEQFRRRSGTGRQA